MEVKFSNSEMDSSLSINDDSSSAEIIIEASVDGSDAWHSFNGLIQLDEFIYMAQVMRDRMAAKIGAPPKYIDERERR